MSLSTRRRVTLRRIVADAGYDSESNHRFAREELGLISIIPPKHGRPTEKPATGKYRRQMQTRFNKRRYRQRAQVETVMSMIKRRQGSHCKGKTHWSRCRELTLMVLTHNILILRNGWVFYRAFLTPFILPKPLDEAAAETIVKHRIEKEFQLLEPSELELLNKADIRNRFDGFYRDLKNARRIETLVRTVISDALLKKALK